MAFLGGFVIGFVVGGAAVCLIALWALGQPWHEDEGE